MCYPDWNCYFWYYLKVVWIVVKKEKVMLIATKYWNG